jgi:cysteine desulfurase family protein (TIGR01976 family)
MRNAVRRHLSGTRSSKPKKTKTFPYAIINEFPALCKKKNKGIFCDGAGGSQVHESVFEAMYEQMRSGAANIGGYYDTSEMCLNTTSQAREAAADWFNCESHEVTFGNNMTTLTFHVAHSIANDTFKEGDNVVLSALDHDANVGPWCRVAQDRGVEVRFLPVIPETCELDTSRLEDLVDSRTRVVAVGYASNAVGTVNDVKFVCKVARSVGALSFIDAVHYAPHGLLDVQDVGCDFMACSPYKFFGPHSGLLFGRAQVMGELLRPYKIRPASDDLPSENNFELSCWELGTQNFEALAGIKACIDYVASLGFRFGTTNQKKISTRRQALVEASKLVSRHETKLREKFLQGISDIPHIKVYGSNRADNRTSTFAIGVSEMDPDTLTQKLCKKHHLYCTSGNHYCTFWNDALGLSNEDGATRMGLLHYNTEEDVDIILEGLENVCCS